MLDIELLRSCGTIKKHNTDSIVTLEGEMGQEMFFILSGKVGVYLNTFADDAVKVTELTTGEIFGEMSLLEELPRTATVIALEPLTVLVIDKDHFEHFIGRQPEMAFKIMKALSARLRSANKTLLELENHSGPVTSNDEQQTDTEKTMSTEDIISVKALFPEEHKTYSYMPDLNSSEYVFDKLISCPVCGNKFMTYAQRMSKLRSKGMDHDLRKRYQNFDPLWYNVWTCPECYYSNYYHEFPGISSTKYKLITDKLKSVLNGQKLSIGKDANINQLFTQYYLLLICAMAMGAPNAKLGKIWMNLMWLYRDCDDDEMVKIASASALKHYQEAYLKCDTNLKPEDEQQLCIILAELNIINGKPEDAVKYLMQARKQNGGNKTFSQMAEFRIEELRKTKS